MDNKEITEAWKKWCESNSPWPKSSESDAYPLPRMPPRPIRRPRVKITIEIDGDDYGPILMRSISMKPSTTLKEAQEQALRVAAAEREGKWQRRKTYTILDCVGTNGCKASTEQLRENK